MNKHNCSINSLPLEIFDCILSYLSDEEIIEVIQVNTKFNEAVESLICRGKKFNFSNRYNLKHESLLYFLKNCEIVRKRLSYLNFNYCYWLGPNVFETVFKLENLQELHIIDCKIASDVVAKILELSLKVLSLSWSWNWLMNLRSRHKRVCEWAADFPMLFLSLKHLVVYMPDSPVGPGSSSYDLLVDMRTYILEYCHDLESLKVYKLNDPHEALRISESSFSYDELPDQPLLPKLKNLILDLPCEYRLIEFITRIMKHRKTLLNEVYFGKAAYSVFERLRNTAFNIFPLMSAKEITTICLDNYSPQLFELFDDVKKDESFIWHNETTPKCSTVSLNNNKFGDSEVLEMVANHCPNMKSLSLNKCIISADNLLFGLSTIARHCHRVTSLILSIDGIGDAGIIDAGTDILKLIGQFHSLKRLHLPYHWATYQQEGDFDVHTLDEIINNAKQLESEMKMWPLYELTQKCTEVEEFCLSLPSDGNYFYKVPEMALACISKWKNLKHLQIVGVTSDGEGNYLALVFRECVHLSFLIASYDWRQNDQALVRGLAYARSLKDLSVCGTLEITNEMCQSLERCVGLQRLYADSIILKSPEIAHFEKILLKLPKLIVFWVGYRSCSIEKRAVLDLALSSLQSIRPAFFYCFGKSSNYSSNNYPVVHNELTRHSFLR